MTTCAFLASEYLSGIEHVLPAAPQDLRTVFVPTAGSAANTAPWVDQQRAWFLRNGIALEELELAVATPDDVAASLNAADLVYASGGNTYFLLCHMQRTNFWNALQNTDLIYAGGSAGAIVACPDIAFIADLDNREIVPELTDTQGFGLVNFSIMPHVDRPEFQPAIERVLADWPVDAALVRLRDEEAIVVATDGTWSVVGSPNADLADLPKPAS